MGTHPILTSGIRSPGSRIRAALVLALGVGLFVVACREVAVTAVDVFRVSVEPPAAQLTVGQTLQLQASVIDVAGRDLGRTVSWNSSAPAVATVNGTGLVSAVGPGSATITASAEGKSGQAQLAVAARPR